MLSWLLSWFWDSPTPPPAGFRVIECTGIDLSTLELVMTTGFIVDARLDGKKLETSLSLLVERKFPRAGARLAKRNGKYEFQIPHKFDAQTPAVIFTTESYLEQYDSLPSRPSLANYKSPPASKEPFLCDAPELRPFLRGPTCPETSGDVLKPNTPLLHVHIAAFDDLTFVGVSATHVGFDALGTKALVHAWTRILAGESLEDIPGMEWDATPFTKLGRRPEGHIQRGWYDLGIVAKALFIGRFVWNLVRDSKEVAKDICVPKSFLEAEKKKAMDELQEAGSSEWVGTSDVLLAWWFKTAYSHQAGPTPLHLHIPVNLREYPIFPTPTGEMHLPYINNAIMSIHVPPFTLRWLTNASLGEIALHIRRAILAYNNDPEGIRNDLRWRIATPTVALFPCPPGAAFSFQTSWRAAAFQQMDFSGAVVEEGRKASVIFVTGFATGTTPLRGSGVVFFENKECIWMNQIRGEKEWAEIRETGNFHWH